MTFETAPTGDPSTATPPNRALVIALIVTVIAAAAAVTALALILLGGDGDPPAVGGASPTPTEQATPESTPSPTVEPTPTPTPEPTPQTELTDGLTHLDYGARATVTTDRLRFRYGPTTHADTAEVLTAGQEMLVLSGPITADNFEWFHVELANREERETTMGWVAAVPAPADSQPDDAWLIRIENLNCPPDAVDTPMLARMSEYAIANCDVQVSSLQGLVDTCYEGGYGPFTFEPGWASFSCVYLRDRESTWSLPVYFPPEMEDRYPDRGDLVTIAGAIGVDTATYGACTVTAYPEYPEDELAIQQQIFAASCPTRFVVADVSIDGHITMPPGYYY
jgi:hypothetical protein